MATASPAEAFSLRERVGSAGGGRDRGNSDTLHELRREYSGQMLITRRSSNIGMQKQIVL